jgi:AbrB family looped-hinge helix DNA binding protein
MKSTIDAAGRVVIPKEIRRQAGLGAGAAVDIRYENGQIEIEPLSVPMKLVQQGQLLVAVPVHDIPPLTSEAVDLTLAALRRERGGLD